MHQIKRGRTLRVVALLVVMLVMVTGVAYAITITIDGVQDSVWTTGAGGQTPGSVTDPNEGLINDGVDVATVRYTNDDTYFYILVETHADTITSQPGPDPYIAICMDIDNNSTTGDSYINCDGDSGTSMDGIERIIEIDLLNSGYTVYQGDFNTVVASSSAGDVATATGITELRVLLSDLGLDSPTACNGAIPMNLYFDGQTTDPDDNTPDNGTFDANCGSPTAVTLLNTNADGAAGALSFGVAAAAFLGLVSLGLVVYRKKQQI